MLGMIVGTASIIAVLGISKAASGGIAATLNSLGDPGISVALDPNQDDLKPRRFSLATWRAMQAATAADVGAWCPTPAAPTRCARAASPKYTG